MSGSGKMVISNLAMTYYGSGKIVIWTRQYPYYKKQCYGCDFEPENYFIKVRDGEFKPVRGKVRSADFKTDNGIIMAYAVKDRYVYFTW